MLVQKYADMLNAKSVIREMAAFAAEREKKLVMKMYLITAWEILRFPCRRNCGRLCHGWYWRWILWMCLDTVLRLEFPL